VISHYTIQYIGVFRPLFGGVCNSGGTKFTHMIKLLEKLASEI